MFGLDDLQRYDIAPFHTHTRFRIQENVEHLYNRKPDWHQHRSASTFKARRLLILSWWLYRTRKEQDDFADAYSKKLRQVSSREAKNKELQTKYASTDVVKSPKRMKAMRDHTADNERNERNTMENVVGAERPVTRPFGGSTAE